MPPSKRTKRRPAHRTSHAVGRVAKFAAPRLRRAVPRERLYSWLDREGQRPLVWLSGPPGAGKTTVVASYLERSTHDVVWYRADSGDIDLATIFNNLHEAALVVTPRAASQLPCLTPEYLLDVGIFARNFFRTLFRLLEPPAAIVFDNFHDAAEGTLEVALKVAVAESTRAVRLFAISRNAPPAAVASLQVSGDIAMLTWDELRLTEEEATSIASVAQMNDPSIVRAQLATCDGWVAGFMLLLENAKRVGPGHRSGLAQSRVALFSYFSGELFAIANADVQHLLLCTALLPDFTLAQADRFAEQAEQTIQWLYRRNFFIDCREGAKPIYRYHDLFRDFLLERGKTVFTTQERRALLCQAAAGAEELKQLETALELMLEAESWTDAARLICLLAPSLLQQGRSISLDRWILTLPPTLPDAMPWLRYWQGIARLTSDPASGRLFLQSAYALFVSQDDTTACLLCCAGILHSFYLEWGEQQGIDPWLEATRRLLQKCDWELPPGSEALVLPGVMGVMMRHAGDALLDWAAERARRLADQTTDPVHRAQLLTFVITHCIVPGRWQEGARLLTQLDRVLTPEMPPLLQLSCYAAKIAWSSMCMECASEAAGRGHIERFIELSESSGVHVLDIFGLGQSVYFALNWRDIPLAVELLGRMRRSLDTRRELDVAHFSWVSAAVAMERGDLSEAAAHMATGMASAQACGSDLGSAQSGVLLAQILLLRGDAQGALREVSLTIDYAKAVRTITLEHTGLHIKAYILLSSGQHREGLETLRAGLVLGRSTGQGLVAPTAHFEMTRYLYSVALREGIEVEHVRKIIKVFRIQPAFAAGPDWPWPIRIYTLGRFAVLKDDVPIRFPGKSQRKPIELLQALIAQGGRSVSITVLTRQLWPTNGASARASFDVALMRLRRLLGSNALLLSRGRLTLDNQVCWVDAWVFEREVTQSTHEPDPCAYDRVFDAYRGLFLPDESKIPCVVAMRDRLSAKFQRAVVAAGSEQERAEHFERAAEIYRTGLEHDNLVEQFHRRLILCEWKLGHRAEAIKSYHRCRDLLSVNLGTGPSVETRALYQRLVAESSA